MKFMPIVSNAFLVALVTASSAVSIDKLGIILVVIVGLN
jgi:hypothetical protein